MPNQADPRRVHPGTYFVQDRSNEEEFVRLRMQDQAMTRAMGGVLPEQADPTIFGRVLDVGCGTGGWLIEAARTYPSMSLLIGVDVNEHLISYAREQAVAQQVSDRVEFHAMDALQMLEFPEGYFDLVNQRFGWSFLRTWEWPHLLNEYRRVTRSDGVIRITESNIDRPSPEETYPALMRLTQLLLQAFYQAGHFFTPESDGVTNQLARLMHQYGLQEVQTRVHPLEYEAGTAEAQFMRENTRRLFRTVVPFMRKWTRVPDDYDALYQQGMREMEQPRENARMTVVTAWGKNPSF